MGSDDPKVLDAVGQYYASQSRWDEAIEILTSAMRKAPEETTYRFHLAVALARSGDVDQAMPHFAKTVGDAEAHYKRRLHPAGTRPHRTPPSNISCKP